MNWVCCKPLRRSGTARFSAAHCRHRRRGWRRADAVMANLFVFPRVFEAEMAVRTDVLSLSTPPANTPPNSFPTAIRWRLHQDLGFPREPFRVFRRPNALSTKRTVLTTSPSAVAGKLVLE